MTWNEGEIRSIELNTLVSRAEKLVEWIYSLDNHRKNKTPCYLTLTGFLRRSVTGKDSLDSVDSVDGDSMGQIALDLSLFVAHMAMSNESENLERFIKSRNK